MNKETIQNRGELIILCGGEGSGKSTVIKAIKDAYPEKVFITREPGGTESPYAEVIRDNMFKNPLAKNANAETMFGQAWAARAEHIDKFLLPTTRKGINVVSDRFDCCTFAYQICAQGGSSLKELFWQTREVYLRDIAPAVYIFLDVPPKVGLERVAGRPGKKNHFDEKDFAFHEAVREGYLTFFEEFEKRSIPSGYHVVDATQSEEQVAREVLNIVASVI